MKNQPQKYRSKFGEVNINWNDDHDDSSLNKSENEDPVRLHKKEEDLDSDSDSNSDLQPVFIDRKDDESPDRVKVESDVNTDTVEQVTDSDEENDQFPKI